MNLLFELNRQVETNVESSPILKRLRDNVSKSPTKAPHKYMTGIAKKAQKSANSPRKEVDNAHT